LLGPPSRRRVAVLACVLLALPVTKADASDPQTSVQNPTPLKTLNDHFPFRVPETRQQWERRAEELRRRVLVATGLWPLPEKTPLHPVVHGKIERDDFTVEKVYFQSLPGHYVSGLLFRPKTPTHGPRPGILSPHGHGGRTMTYSDDEIADLLDSGGEHFEDSGRMPKVARCAQLARMGCVSFIFDMLGYADSQQIDYKTAHRHGNPRPEEREREPWIFYSVEADLRLQSIMGLQTWNAIRALDFLAQLPDVDADRLAVTGGSGGGTQTIILGAIDERVKVSFPNGMVSTSMQGGCHCENCCLLRVGTGNVELAALFAPKPQAMTAADDWTKEMMTDGFPELQKLYTMLGAADQVACRPLLQFPHNYNYVTRATMYQWMNRHLKLGLHEPIVESDFPRLTPDEMAVWNQDHPAPTETGISHEREVLGWWDQQSRDALAKANPNADQPDSLQRFHNTIGDAWRTILNVPTLQSPPAASIDLKPADVDSKRVVLACGFDRDPQAARLARIKELLQDSSTIVAVVASPLQSAAQTTQPLIDDERDNAAFTFCYNPTLVAKQTASFGRLIRTLEVANQEIVVIASADAASWATPAVALAGAAVSNALIETGGFRYASVDHYRHARFVPGAVKYGDLPALAAMRAPYPLVLCEPDSGSLSLIRSAYDSIDASDEITLVDQLTADPQHLQSLLDDGSEASNTDDE
ncbi:MAG: alpha/beta hydrolase family protein, partial [Planctomycetota bacterium]